MTVEKSERVYLLTVVVPIARMAGKLENLKKWVDSAIGLEVKILLIHDHQDSETSQELREYVEKLGTGQVQLLEKYYGSPGMARNAGLLNIKSEWCCFWDSDDTPDVGATLLSIYQAKSDTEVIISKYAVHDFDETKIVSHNFCLDQVAINPGIWRMVFKSRRIKDKEFTDLLMGEDQIFLLEIGLSTLKVEFSDAVTYTYHQGLPSQLTKQFGMKSLRAIEVIRTNTILSQSTHDRFLTIVFTRMFITSLKRLRFSYPINELTRNLIFLIRLPLPSVVFTFNKVISQKIGNI